MLYCIDVDIDCTLADSVIVMGQTEAPYEKLFFG